MDLSQFPDNDPFYEFFKRLVPNMPDMPQEDTESDDLNFGSGFIISKDGYILTNTHVVAGMGNIKVLLNDKREYTAKLVGSDAQSDVALLKIEPQEDLPVVKIGNPKDLKPGDGWRPSAHRSVSTTASPPASFPPRAAAAERELYAVHPDRRRPSTPAIRADRCLT